mmetsp:Transcript_20709/g.31153  ORF Transcript_20709/g.31153 Transcript_20709/m.31153 type:complete len:253 (-) Transcript_20709:194-952(-)|eukprot:CAMPEP_0178930606 /NCGR_PEP_ID=MMETSP0786-20121207/21348_1 /TAXON_ID=186022 /ORGANISM="Thalassionema frauenfeldii, Strain CCMP 1798" /LENGTH=252 /DNA_ID=CAMNT_0020607191 /DNA_START=260 /DNA_END=1018 /DNA_ORIENTATION=-
MSNTRPMVLDTIFDSVCRCLGVSGNQPKKAPSSEKILVHQQKRTDRVQLQDKQFDQLFNESKRKLKNHQPQSRQSTPKSGRAAQPRTNHKSTKKRKSPATLRDEIFRSKDSEFRDKPVSSGGPGSALKFSVAQALCFATPVVDDTEEDHSLRITESDCNTLNTCEDTITSTLFFEKKYAHIVENRPPMPLFNQFKVDDKNELRRIVAADSHNSMKMVHLMKTSPKKALNKKRDEEVPPAIKIDSSESADSRR